MEGPISDLLQGYHPPEVDPHGEGRPLALILDDASLEPGLARTFLRFPSPRPKV